MSDVQVVFSWYPQGEEKSYATRMPQVPQVGDSVQVPGMGEEQSIMQVTHVRWVAVHLATAVWCAEVSLG